MSAVVDYRTIPFNLTNVGSSGKYIGDSIYWKLFAVENLIRVLIHSVLSAQYGTHWWKVAVDSDLSEDVIRLQRYYAKQPRRTAPGRHEIYYVYLRDLNRIILTHIHLFRPLIADIDQLMTRIEEIRLPRNVVGHMNWLNILDKQEIDATYSELKRIVRKYLRSGAVITIP